MSPNTDRFRVLRRLPEIKFEDELRGYSKSQVDRVLESLAPLADDVDELMARLSEAETRAASAEARLVEHSPNALAESSAPAAPVPAPQPAAAQPVAEESVAGASAAPTQQPPVDFDETLRNTMLLAQRTADTAVREANDEAARIRTEAAEEVEREKASAREEAESIRAENERTRIELAEATDAERAQLADDLRTETETRRSELETELETAHGEQRAALITQIDELQRTRDILNGDIETLAIHLDARRTAIRRAVDELTLALDDPERLTDVDVPELESGDDLDPDSFAPVAIPLASDDVESSVGIDDILDGSDDRDTNVETVSGNAGATGAESTGLLLGEADPAPEAVGDATQPVDVLAMDDDDEYDDDTVGAGASDFGRQHDAAIGGDSSMDDGDSSSEPSGDVTDPWVQPDASSPSDMQSAADRPAWADAVPTDDELAPVQGGGQDPFLDELRRVTDSEDGDRDSEDEALSRFLSDDNEEDTGKSGWFGRKR